MKFRPHWTAAVGASLLLAASASGTSFTPGQRQQQQLDQACLQTVANVQPAVKDAQITAIHSTLQVVIPGRLSGQIAFNGVRSRISRAARRASSAATDTLGCANAMAHPAAGASHVVSTLHRKFTKPGRYELTFTLNSAGRKILAELASDDDAYFKAHPHGQQPPTLGFGVSLSYSPAG